MKVSPSSERARRIGLLGGTFDPIHYGHLVIAEEVRAALQLSEVVFIPTGEPPHKPGRTITPTRHRVAMLELALASNPCFSISRIEVERSGPSYTVDTLRLLRSQWGPEAVIDFIIGGDSLEDLPTWHDPQGILLQVDHLVAVHRPGYTEVPGSRDALERRLPGLGQCLILMSAPQLEISATDLRRRVAEGRPIKYQTPKAVETYIAQQKLYQGADPGTTRKEIRDAHAF